MQLSPSWFHVIEQIHAIVDRLLVIVQDRIRMTIRFGRVAFCFANTLDGFSLVLK